MSKQKREAAHPHYYTSGDCARVLDLSIGYIYELTRQGVLTPCATAGTMKLYDPEEVHRLQRERTASPPRRGRPPLEKPRLRTASQG